MYFLSWRFQRQRHKDLVTCQHRVWNFPVLLQAPHSWDEVHLVNKLNPSRRLLYLTMSAAKRLSENEHLAKKRRKVKFWEQFISRHTSQKANLLTGNDHVTSIRYLAYRPHPHNPFSNENGTVFLRIRRLSTLQLRKRAPKTEPFENALQSGVIWKRWFLKTLFSSVDGENDAIWKRRRHQNRHDQAPNHRTSNPEPLFANIPFIPLHYQVDPPIFRKILLQKLTFLNVNDRATPNNK